MSSKLTSIDVGGTSYVNGGIPGFSGKKIKNDDLPEGQKLAPLETNTTLVAKKNAEEGVWAYPGLDQYVNYGFLFSSNLFYRSMSPGNKFLIAFIIILVLVAAPVLYYYKKRSSDPDHQMERIQRNQQQQQARQEEAQAAGIDENTATALERAL